MLTFHMGLEQVCPLPWALSFLVSVGGKPLGGGSCLLSLLT